MTGAPPELDLRQVRRAFGRAAKSYAGAAFVPKEIGRRMEEKLDFIRHEPRLVLDAGAGDASGIGILRRRYPRARFVGLDAALPMLDHAKRARSWLEQARDFALGASSHWICGDLARLPLGTGSADMIWSSLALAWVNDPLAALREFHRVLAPGGLLLFSTYGPDTLLELKQAFAAGDAARHVHEFIDMHDIGDMLVQSGFDAPVMEMEKLNLTYADVGGLMRDLRLSGQTCAARDRRRALMTPRAWERMKQAYENLRRDGRLPVTVEAVYGHTWRGEARAAPDGRQIVKLERARR